MVPSCAEGGVLGVLPGLIGTLQATEAIKLLTGSGSSGSGRGTCPCRSGAKYKKCCGGPAASALKQAA